MKRQSKKEKEIIDKFRKDTEGMTSKQVMEYYALKDADKEKFVQKFRDEHGIRHIAHENHIEDSKLIKRKTEKNLKLSSPKSSELSKLSLTKKEREKGLRAERIWVKGNPNTSHECQCANDLRNAGQYIERSNYFKNRDLLKAKREAGDKEFKISKKDRYISYNELDKMKDMVEFVIDDNGAKIDKYKKFKEAYRSMTMACLSQQILILTTDSWEGYYEGLFGFYKGDPNYTGKPNMPGYGDKGGEYIVVIPNNMFKIVSGQDVEKSWSGIEKRINTLAFEPGLSYLKLDGLETRLDDKANLREIRIVPAGVGYWIEIVYKLKEDERKKELLKIKDKDKNVDNKDKNGNEDLMKLDSNRIMGIDLGLRNFATIGFAEIDTLGGSGKIIGQPINFKGGVSKSINQYYNKVRAETQSIYEKQCWKLKRTLRHLKFQYNVKTKNSNASKEVRDSLYKEIQVVKGELKKIRTGINITKLAFDRNNKMMDLMHKYSRYIIGKCIEMRIGTIVIGHNKGQKQSIELGGITNQNFVFIPFYKFIKMIKYKAEEVGILVIEQEESYTSKCSFPDSEEVKKHSKYLGKRISRGMFRTAAGLIINADVNGAYNIIRKAFPKIKFLVDGIEGVRLHPVRVNPLG
jgi:putative transposase